MYLCEACGDYYFADYTEKAKHTFTTEKTVEPTCTEEGYTVYICTVCNVTYHGDATAALGHKYKDGVCAVCKEKESEKPEQEPEQKPEQKPELKPEQIPGGNNPGQNNGSNPGNGADKNNVSGNPANKTSAANTGDTVGETAKYFMFSMAGAGIVLCMSLRRRRKKNNQ